MSIHPELESKLRSRAEAEGVTLDAYLERLLQEEDAAIAHTEALLQDAAESGDYMELTESEWDKMELEAMEEAQARARAKLRA
jgi:hypothetical protein